MFNMFLITMCLQSVPYGNYSDLVPNKLIKSTKISTGLFYSIHLPEHGKKLLTYKNISISGAQCPVLVGGDVRYSKDRVSDSNLFVFHPAGLGDNVKMFHKELLAPVILSDAHNTKRYMFMKSSNFNYHHIRNKHSSRLSNSEMEAFLKHCTASSFKLKQTNSYYEILNNDASEVIAYNPDSKELSPTTHTSSNPALLKLVPERFRMSAVITEFDYNDFSYTDLEALAVEVPSVHAWNFTNESYTTSDSHTVQINERVANTAEWSFSNSLTTNAMLELGWSVEASADFFFGSAKAGAHGSVKFDLGYTSSNTKTQTTLKETGFHLSSTITVAPRHSTQYMLVWKKVDIEVAFTATVKIHAFADRINKDGSVSKMVRVDPEGVLAIIEHQGFKGTIKRNGNEIINYINGTVHVKGATKGQTRRRDLSLDNTPVTE